MPRFPTLQWCEALVAEAQKEQEISKVALEWGGRSLGVVISADDELDADFCVFAKPHSTRPEMLALKVCEDEDDLELEEPDFFFKVPFSLTKKLISRQVDPLAVLRAGQLRADGDLKFLVPFAQRWQSLGERISDRLETIL